MAPRSGRQKSGSSIDRGDAARLLRDGAVTRGPSPALIKAAKRLEKVGLVEAGTPGNVLCAEPKDADVSPRNQHCRGRIYLKEDLDMSGYEFRCRECEEPVILSPDSSPQRCSNLLSGVIIALIPLVECWLCLELHPRQIEGMLLERTRLAEPAEQLLFGSRYKHFTLGECP